LHSLAPILTQPCMLLWLRLRKWPLIPHRLPLHHNYTVPLVDQAKQFVDNASHVLSHPKGQTLIAWFEGINDTGRFVGKL
jgi:hypothetical protein